MCASNDVKVIVLHEQAVRTAVNADRSQLYEERWVNTNDTMRHQSYSRSFTLPMTTHTRHKKCMILLSCVI